MGDAEFDECYEGVGDTKTRTHRLISRYYAYFMECSDITVNAYT